jgi:uncharacterized protein involved in outer membrane biogenesis
MTNSLQAIRTRATAFLRSERARKIAIWALSIFVAIGILGAVVAPYVLRRVLSNQLTAKLHRPATIEQVLINPYAMTAAIRGLLIKERDGTATAFSFDELFINLELLSVFRAGLVLKEVRLTKPYINVVRDEDLKYNFQDLIDEFTSGPPGGPTPRFSVSNIQISDGKIDFDDRPERTQHNITGIHLGLPFISSLPSHSDIFVKPAFSALVNGTPVEIKGDAKPFHGSHESIIQLHIDDLQIPKYLEYSPVKLNFTVPSGRIDGQLTAAFKSAEGQEATLAITGELALRDLIMKESGDTPLFSLPIFDVGIDSLRIFSRNASLKTIKAQGLELYIKRDRDGQINFARLVETQPKQSAESTAPAADKPFVYNIGQLLLESATVHYADETTGKLYQTRLDDLHVAIKDLSNEPDKKAAVEISFATEAKERVTHSGTVQLTPLIAEGKLQVEGLRPDGFKPFYQDALALEIRDGFVDLSTRYMFQESENGADVKLSELEVTLRDLRLEEPDKKPLWRIPLLTVKDASIDLAKKAIAIGSIEGKDGSGFIQRNADGTLNYDRVMKSQPKQAPPKEPVAKNDPNWTIEAKQIVLNRFKIDFEDNALSLSAKLALSDIAVRVDRFITAKNQRAKVAIQASINKGRLRMNGTVGVEPILAQLQIEGRDIDLLPFQPYLQNQVTFTLTGGRLGTRGNLDVNIASQSPVQVAYKGDVSVSDFATIEGDASQDLLKWNLLALNGLQFALNPMQVRVNDIDLAGFYARIVIAADGKVNLQNLTVEKAPTPDATGASKAASDPPPAPASAPEDTKQISIGKISMREGNINFSDFFVKPNYSANLTDVQGTIAELKPDAPGDLAIQAKLDGSAPVDIQGRINPLGKELFMDIKAKASEIELSALTPYSAKYVGYGIEKGQLTFDVAYKLENRKLDAQTQFILNQLTFGEKIPSPTAMNLPVNLAVSLLKDRNGVIDVNLPISGSLDDPQFSIGGLILRVIVNLITRAVTAPFSLLGAAFGGGGAELSYIEFDYGRATLSQTAEAKTKTLANAMTNRPGLKLEITGRAEPGGDLEGLKRVSIENKVRAQKLKDLARQGNAPKSVEEVQVSKEEYERYLRAAYDTESFPKPRNLIGLAQTLPVPEMENLMLKHAAVSDGDVRALANRRAQVVRDRLLAANISADRLFIIAAKPAAKEEQAKTKARPSRVDFSLR